MKVLLVKTSSMGDVVHTLPALTDARAAIPDIQFDWVVEEAFQEIPAWHDAVDRVIPVAIRRWRKSLVQTWKRHEWRSFKRSLRQQTYDYVIDAQGLIKSAWITSKSLGPKYGLDRDSAREPLASRFYDFPLAVAKGQHAVERTRQLFAQSLGYPLPAERGNAGIQRDIFTRENLPEAAPYLVFLHGTTWPDKHWPDAYWCELGRELGQLGYEVRLPWGNDTEKSRAELIAASCDNVLVLPRLNLTSLAGQLVGSVGVVTVDTGLGHLSAALNIPAVALFGPTQPSLVSPYGEKQMVLEARNCPPVDQPDIEPEVFRPLTPAIVLETLAGMLGEGHSQGCQP